MRADNSQIRQNKIGEIHCFSTQSSEPLGEGLPANMRINFVSGLSIESRRKLLQLKELELRVHPPVVRILRRACAFILTHKKLYTPDWLKEDRNPLRLLDSMLLMGPDQERHIQATGYRELVPTPPLQPRTFQCSCFMNVLGEFATFKHK